MAYQAPRTWTAGEFPTAAQFNQDIRDNVSFLANPPACRVYHGVSQTLPNGVATDLTFGSELFDTDSMHSTATNPARITFNTAGLYVVGGNIAWTGNSAGVRRLRIVVNSVVIIADGQQDVDSASAHHLNVGCIYKFGVGDFVTLQGFQNSGGDLSVPSNANYSPHFWAGWMGLG